eukprot:2300080-Alexandrium_andersonii.AAC.1
MSRSSSGSSSASSSATCSASSSHSSDERLAALAGRPDALAAARRESRAALAFACGGVWGARGT